MISEHDRLSKIDEVEILSQEQFLIYQSTWNLISSPLRWSMHKKISEIEERIEICYEMKNKQWLQQMKNNWQLIIETLRWIIEENETDPIESRRELIPFA